MEISKETHAIEVREMGRRLASDCGLTRMGQSMVAAVITELSSNILQHAESGEIAIEIVEIAGRQAIVIRAKDQGPGIPSVKEALESSFSVAAGMGIGLRGVRALVDRLEIISFPGRGTTVTAQIWRS